VVGSDEQVPELAADFTSQVMRRVERPRRRIPLRPVIVGGLGLQAAAVLLIVLFMQRSEPAAKPGVSGGNAAWASVGVGTEDPGEVALKTWIIERIEDRAWDMHAAGATLAADLGEMRQYMHRYANTIFPEDLRESAQTASLGGLMEVFGPSEEEETEPAPPSTEGLHSI
jgi:hypothetical protein